MRGSRLGCSVMIVAVAVCAAGVHYCDVIGPTNDEAGLAGLIWCVAIGVPLVLLGPLLMPALRRRTKPWVGASLGFVFGAWVGGCAGLLLAPVVLAGIGFGAPSDTDATGLTVLPAALAGMIAGGIAGAAGAARLWKRSTSSPRADPD